MARIARVNFLSLKIKIIFKKMRMNLSEMKMSRKYREFSLKLRFVMKHNNDKKI